MNQTPSIIPDDPARRAALAASVVSRLCGRPIVLVGMMGAGKTSGGRHPVSPWGQPTRGHRTRNVKKASSKLIVRGRKRGKGRK